MNYETARYNMVEQQIRPWDVLDQRVLDAVMGLRRDAFVPKEFRQLAYTDTAIPLTDGRSMMTPKLEARLAQELRLNATDRVLEVGTGAGFLTALLARLAGQGHVYSTETSNQLSRMAAANLLEQGVENVTLSVADGSRGLKDHAPYDAIAVTGSLPELNDQLLQSLSVGGRLFAVVGEAPVMEAVLVTRGSTREWARASLFETDLPPLAGLPEREEFVF